MKPLSVSALLGLLLLPALAFPAENSQAGPEFRRTADSRQPWGQQFPSKAEWEDSNHATPNGTLYQTFLSTVLGTNVSYLVWLPPGYEQSANRYPVIYWLHGMGGNQRAGAMMFVPRVEAAIQQGILPPAIVVLVNGMVNSFYCDSADGRRPVESVIVKDLIPHVDRTYRTVANREGRIIEGYSMGGYGAGHLGFKYPELFGTVVINAGALLEPNLPNAPTNGPMFAVFGKDTHRRAAEHPRELARRNADQLRGKTRIRIACGSLDNLLPRNLELHETLLQLGLEHQYQVVPEVAHNSGLFYQRLGPKAFEFHRQSLAASDK
jgi:endo-1,4-beta-xylanase